jgi:TfoX/Sxy family transcriptional regulator of competence genes
MREYVRLPREVLDNQDQFVDWVQKSASYAMGRIL